MDKETPHAELILYAYLAFGERFLDYIIGDFAFAIWDGPQSRLICARDHFGVRPFYFSEAGEFFAFGSDVEALLVAPGVSQRLDEQSIADFLLVGMCQDADRTIYSDIRCLAPGHSMVISQNHLTQRRYWQLPRGAETRYRTKEEYVERFRQLFNEAVADRLPSGPVALQLSGGMDSTAIAAVAANHCTRSGCQPTAYHLSCTRVEPRDDEGVLAKEVADRLGMPMVLQNIDDYPLFAGSRDAALRTSMPHAYPHLAVYRETLAQIVASGSRVLLSGYAGDAVLMTSPTYYSDLLRNGRLLKFSVEAMHHISHQHSLAGMGLRSALRRSSGAPDWKPPMPDWIDGEFASRVGLASRWNRWWTTHQDAFDAHRQLRLTWMQRRFEANEILPFPVVSRYPFLDIRLVQFLVSIPNFMLSGKKVLRDAMSGVLPDSVRLRPKVALVGDPARTLVTNGKLDSRAWDVSERLPSPLTRDRFVTAWQSYFRKSDAESTMSTWLLFQSLAFANWMSQFRD